MKQKENGFTHVALLLLVIVIVAVFGVGYYVMNNEKDKDNPRSASSVSKNDESQSSCPEPILQLPTELENITSILYPGQERGGNYKPHGGFRLDNLSSNTVKVIAPMDAKLVAGSRYIEQGEEQILLDFQSSCGVKFRFDHLLTLSPEIQAEVNKLPEAKVDDSRTTNFTNQISVKTGDVIATEVGFAKSKNVSFDFGVYDTRQPNASSEDKAYKAAHPDLENNEQLKYAVCWLDFLAPEVATALKSLPAGDQAAGKTSDYCN